MKVEVQVQRHAYAEARQGKSEAVRSRRCQQVVNDLQSQAIGFYMLWQPLDMI